MLRQCVRHPIAAQVPFDVGFGLVAIRIRSRLVADADGLAKQAHECAAVFDQPIPGKIRVTGQGSEALLDRVCTNDMSQPRAALSIPPC